MLPRIPMSATFDTTTIGAELRARFVELGVLRERDPNVIPPSKAHVTIDEVAIRSVAREIAATHRIEQVQEILSHCDPRLRAPLRRALERRIARGLAGVGRFGLGDARGLIGYGRAA
jgi:hypothetical protein